MSVRPEEVSQVKDGNPKRKWPICKLQEFVLSEPKLSAEESHDPDAAPDESI